MGAVSLSLAFPRFLWYASPMGLAHIRVVLVEPLYGGNVGAVCRAMKNMGLSDLAVVRPQADCDGLEARKMALRAADILEARRSFDCARDAVADCVLVGATSAREGFHRGHARTAREWAPRFLEASEQGSVALLFGREDKGLCNEDLKLATQIVRIPSAPDYPSLNLSQAVLICCYELFVAAGAFVLPPEPHPEAPSRWRERMFDAWDEALREIGFMQEDKAEHMMRGLRRILSRSYLSEGDAKILLGMARQITWAGRRLPAPQAKAKKRGGSRD
jgi:TrmH family RNA methyltransferase